MFQDPRELALRYVQNELKSRQHSDAIQSLAQNNLQIAEHIFDWIGVGRAYLIEVEGKKYVLIATLLDRYQSETNRKHVEILEVT